MGVTIKGNGGMVIWRAKAFLNGKITTFMKEIGSIIPRMAKGF